MRKRSPRRRVICVKETIVFHRPDAPPPDPIPPVTALECGHEVQGYTVGRYRACPECAVNEFEQELVGELILHGYDRPVARMVTELVCQNLIDPFGPEFPTVRKALESLGVFDLESLQAKFSS